VLTNSAGAVLGDAVCAGRPTTETKTALAHATDTHVFVKLTIDSSQGLIFLATYHNSERGAEWSRPSQLPNRFATVTLNCPGDSVEG